MLRAEGLVVSRRRVGTFASEIDRERMDEVFDAREMIEQRVVPIVLHNVSDRQIDALGTILEEASNLVEIVSPDQFDYPRFMELDALFHAEFIKLSERSMYVKWFDELAAHMQRCATYSTAMRFIARSKARKNTTTSLPPCAIAMRRNLASGCWYIRIEVGTMPLSYSTSKPKHGQATDRRRKVILCRCLGKANSTGPIRLAPFGQLSVRESHCPKPVGQHSSLSHRFMPVCFGPKVGQCL